MSYQEFYAVYIRYSGFVDLITLESVWKCFASAEFWAVVLERLAS